MCNLKVTSLTRPQDRWVSLLAIIPSARVHPSCWDNRPSIRGSVCDCKPVVMLFLVSYMCPVWISLLRSVHRIRCSAGVPGRSVLEFSASPTRSIVAVKKHSQSLNYPIPRWGCSPNFRVPGDHQRLTSVEQFRTGRRSTKPTIFFRAASCRAPHVSLRNDLRIFCGGALKENWIGKQGRGFAEMGARALTGCCAFA